MIWEVAICRCVGFTLSTSILPGLLEVALPFFLPPAGRTGPRLLLMRFRGNTTTCASPSPSWQICWMGVGNLLITTLLGSSLPGRKNQWMRLPHAGINQWTCLAAKQREFSVWRENSTVNKGILRQRLSLNSNLMELGEFNKKIKFR